MDSIRFNKKAGFLVSFLKFEEICRDIFFFKNGHVPVIMTKTKTKRLV